MNQDDFERAVALHYDREGAPTVLASGEGQIARLIKERADAAGIPMVEDPKLSYLLSKIPLGDEIHLSSIVPSPKCWFLFYAWS